MTWKIAFDVKLLKSFSDFIFFFCIAIAAFRGKVVGRNQDTPLGHVVIRETFYNRECRFVSNSKNSESFEPSRVIESSDQGVSDPKKRRFGLELVVEL